jgi:hypothetical protein
MGRLPGRIASTTACLRYSHSLSDTLEELYPLLVHHRAGFAARPVHMAFPSVAIKQTPASKIRAAGLLAHCSDFCSDLTPIRPHPRTSRNMLRCGLKPDFSVGVLRTGWLLKLARLPWAQEVWSSNLHAPTKSISIKKLQEPIFALLHCGAPWEQLEKFLRQNVVRTSPKRIETLRAVAGRLCVR